MFLACDNDIACDIYDIVIVAFVSTVSACISMASIFSVKFTEPVTFEGTILKLSLVLARIAQIYV